jgi:carboxylesterase
MTQIMKGAQPFFLPAGSTGCLLLHGFTGAPNEMRWMGEYLSGRGYTVLAPRIFAHGTQLSDMYRARWKDWVASAEDGYHLLAGSCDQVFIAGLSMGGALSLLLGSYLPVSAVIAMAAPYEMHDPMVRRLRPILPLLSVFLKSRPKASSGILDPIAEQLHVDYAGFPVRGGYELQELLAAMRNQLSKLDKPTLLINAKLDTSVPPEHVQSIYAALASTDKQILMLEEGGHNIPRDLDRQTAFSAAGDFIQRVASENG